MGVPILAGVAEIMSHGGGDVLWSAAEAVRSAEEADRVSIASFTDERFTIIAHAGWGLLGRDATLPLTTSTHFLTAAQGRAFLANDFDRQPGFGRPVDQLVMSNGFRSGCSVPMWVGKRLVGALSVSCADSKVSAAERLPRLEGVAALLAVHLAVSPASAPACVVVCSDRPLLAHGVARLLEGDGTAVTVATSRDDVLVAVSNCEGVPVVVAEAYFAGRPVDRLMQQVRCIHPSARLAVLSEHDKPEVRAQVGALGGTFLGTRPEDVRARVRDLIAGRRPPAHDPWSAAPVAVELTARETDVLLALDQGLAVRQAARALGVTEATVKGYMRTLFTKLSVHSRAEAVHRARTLGLLESALALRADA
ncbi:MAG: hypothetical protein JWP46_3764 [Modestobacter sp.]|nr:hypothetical protein [Modestobacter sp.]